MRRIFFLTLLAAGFLFAADKVDRLRLDGVMYLSDFMDKPVEVKAIQPAYVTFSRDGTSVLGKVWKDQRVRLVGIGEHRYLISGRLENGMVEGWVVPSDFEPIPEEIWKEIQTKKEAAEKIKKAIEKGEVIVGMNQDTVQKVLGAPGSKSKITEEGGSFEQWTYTAYKTIPYHVPSTVNGTNYMSLFYRKVPIGSKVVTFQEGKVIRFESKQEDATAVKDQGTIVVPQIIVH